MVWKLGSLMMDELSTYGKDSVIGVRNASGSMAKVY